MPGPLVGAQPEVHDDDAHAVDARGRDAAAGQPGPPRQAHGGGGVHRPVRCDEQRRRAGAATADGDAQPGARREPAQPQPTREPTWRLLHREHVGGGGPHDVDERVDLLAQPPQVVGHDPQRAGTAPGVVGVGRAGPHRVVDVHRDLRPSPRASGEGTPGRDPWRGRRTRSSAT